MSFTIYVKLWALLKEKKLFQCYLINCFRLLHYKINFINHYLISIKPKKKYNNLHNCVSGIAELRHTDPSTCATIHVCVIPNLLWPYLMYFNQILSYSFYNVICISHFIFPCKFFFLYLHIPIRVNSLFNFITLFLSCGKVHISLKSYRFF